MAFSILLSIAININYEIKCGRKEIHEHGMRKKKNAREAKEKKITFQVVRSRESARARGAFVFIIKSRNLR